MMGSFSCRPCCLGGRRSEFVPPGETSKGPQWLRPISRGRSVGSRPAAIRSVMQGPIWRGEYQRCGGLTLLGPRLPEAISRTVVGYSTKPPA